MILPPPRSTLVPYTTLFRSVMTEHRARDFRAEERLDHRGTNGRVLAQKSELLLRQIAFAIEASVIEGSEEHTSELQSRQYLVCRLLLEKKTKSTSRLTIIAN